ncbi:Permease of the drug/metabolite transporter (DMT) superfamily [Filimonas lacunae]|uniref:Permease of the drug/metabolite transporter (DMT) superfamily n=1 Tax=Filimonas lacunae TaxID=477680 RepID=A0A173MIU7_9BACT|nr:EamA family transporter [Filimonas lacunae]BAV07420.1 permease of the drug/metabolite transporter (DMT) superfamily [Filimonas lacunae]SIT30442.1 Permease of the drug/metabolite transporter (DMT) superfamily [Filimonas lacunae]
MGANEKQATTAAVVLAFATVYIVWGSTYFFIQRALVGFSPVMLGAFRFTTAGLLMMLWCVLRKESLFNRQQIKYAVITGLLLLFGGTGAVMLVETTLPSSLVGVIITSEVVWLVLFDKAKWKENFANKGTIPGLLLGLTGVYFLFAERIQQGSLSGSGWAQVGMYAILIGGTMSWAAGSVFSKYKAFGSSTVNSAWQMLAAGVAFFITGAVNGNLQSFQVQSVPVNAWLSLLYLVLAGSLGAFSAYVWLLKVRPITQVSTHLYVNPVVAVLLGVLFADEHMSGLQVGGLTFILVSVLLINLTQYRRKKQATAGETNAGNSALMFGTKEKCVL